MYIIFGKMSRGEWEKFAIVLKKKIHYNKSTGDYTWRVHTGKARE
jgi:hypothetical protein